MTGRERLARADDAGQRVVVSVGAQRTLRVDDPADRRAGLDAPERSSAVRRKDELAGELVHTLGFPLAKRSPDARTELDRIAAGVVDALVEP